MRPASKTTRLCFQVSVIIATFVAGAGIYAGARYIGTCLWPPILFVSDASVDFGVLPAGSTVTRVIQLTNKGGTLLRIKHIRTGCGCTDVALSKRELAPGESADLLVTVTAKAVASDDSVDVFLVSNDPASPVCRLVAKFGSVSEAVIVPPQIDFANVSRSELPCTEKCRVFTRKTGVAKLDLQNAIVTVDAPFLKTRIRNVSDDTGEPNLEVFVELSKETPSGELYSQMCISDQASRTMLDVDILGNVRGQFYALPVMVDFGRVSSGDREVVERVVVKCRQKKVIPRLGDSVISDSFKGILKVEPIESAEQKAIFIRMVPTEYAGVWSDRVLRGYIRVLCYSTNDYQEWINIPVRLTLHMPKLHQE